MSVLIWVQTVYKGYHQTMKVAGSKERVQSVSFKRGQQLMTISYLERVIQMMAIALF